MKYEYMQDETTVWHVSIRCTEQAEKGWEFVAILPQKTTNNTVILYRRELPPNPTKAA